MIRRKLPPRDSEPQKKGRDRKGAGRGGGKLLENPGVFTSKFD